MVGAGSPCRTMTHALKFFIVLLSARLAHSTTLLDKIKLEGVRLKLGDNSIHVFLDNPSHDSLQGEDLTGKPQAPIELGVQLFKHGIDLTSAEDLGSNKIGFGEITLELKNRDGEEKCTEVSWRSVHENVTLEDCFRLSPHHWFGGPEQSDQYWPIENTVFKEYSYVSKELDSMAIAEPYWLNSDGLFIYVDPTVPLFIDQNNHREESICFLAKHDLPYVRKGGPSLKYTVCKFENPRVAHEYAIEKFLGKPSDIPDTKMVKYPIWSTWARYKNAISDEVVLQFAKEINDHGFQNSQLEIDDIWEVCYGSLSFNKTTFPSMKQTVTQLNKMGFRTTIWVHPFIDPNCDEHKEGLAKGYFVKNPEGNTIIPWWNGVASYIDFTNQDAADWYERRLRKMLAEGGIDSLKFDAGESSWMPLNAVLNDPKTDHPQLIVKKYVELAAKFAPMVEVRAARHTQHLPIFYRMIDRESLWGFKTNGLNTVITTSFQMTLNGYPFILPDMVGGNGYTDKVTKEMFIRYLQMNVFMPVIQFSIAPWDYDSETVQLSKKYLSLHHQYSDKIIDLMKKTVRTGQPVNMPIWWVDPTNKETHSINSEYMLGEDILVAPVLEKGATSRDIYLPKGQWRDEAKADKPVHTGPMWLRSYSAPLDTLPYFTRVSSSAGRLSFGLVLFVGITCLLTVFR